MTEILIFPTERVRPIGRNQDDDLAEVLIFPGIRIERGEFSLSDRLPPANPKRTRAVPAKIVSDERS